MNEAATYADRSNDTSRDVKKPFASSTESFDSLGLSNQIFGSPFSSEGTENLIVTERLKFPP